MKTFKFLTETKPTEYDGEWSQKAIRIVANFVSTRFTSGRRVITQDAQYVTVILESLVGYTLTTARYNSP